MTNSQQSSQLKIIVELPTTSDLFNKHFSQVYGGAGVGIFHPNMEAFFNELNDVCIIEDAIKEIKLQQ